MKMVPSSESSANSPNRQARDFRGCGEQHSLPLPPPSHCLPTPGSEGIGGRPLRSARQAPPLLCPSSLHPLCSAHLHRSMIVIIQPFSLQEAASGLPQGQLWPLLPVAQLLVCDGWIRHVRLLPKLVPTVLALTHVPYLTRVDKPGGHCRACLGGQE